jgi:hypothetical protein
MTIVLHLEGHCRVPTPFGFIGCQTRFQGTRGRFRNPSTLIGFDLMHWLAKQFAGEGR